MEYKHISQINFAENINERVFGIFLAQDVEVKMQKDGVTKFLNLTMMDKDLKLNVKRFGASDRDIELMQNGKVYYAAIDVKPYKQAPGGYSCNIYNFDIYDESPANFIEWADGMQPAFEVIQSTLKILSSGIYGQIVNNLVTQHWEQMSIWAAATGFHHNILGGLLVHTAEVIEQSMVIADYWNKRYGEKFINKDLLLSASILHDIAKVNELNVDKFSGSIEYSKASALETHITMCISMLEIEAYKIGFGYKLEGKEDTQVEKEKEAFAVLKHCILAHHGKKEYGSPITMNCPEAYILHTADSISAEMYRYNKNFKSMEPDSFNSTWLGGNICITYKDATK